MATSIKELEKKAKREQWAKDFANQYQSKNIDVHTRKKYDGTNYRKINFVSK